MDLENTDALVVIELFFNDGDLIVNFTLSFTIFNYDLITLIITRGDHFATMECLIH